MKREPYIYYPTENILNVTGWTYSKLYKCLAKWPLCDDVMLRVGNQYLYFSTVEKALEAIESRMREIKEYHL